ncbi:MAG: lysylphosphatidylglycerol synthase transmembrane domain-containing protein [Clostridia bacterium]
MEDKKGKLVDEICEYENFNNGEEKALTQEEINATTKKARRKLLLRFLFILISFAVIVSIFLIEFKDENLQGLINIIANSKTSYFIIGAVICLLLVIALQSVRMALIVKFYVGKFHFKLSYKVSQIGRYYDNLTPSGVGGQPMQIYYFHKNGLSGSDSSGITVVNFLANQFAAIIVAITLFTINNKALQFDGLNSLGYIGLVFYTVFPILIVIFSLNKNVGAAIFSFVYKVGMKLHIIKADKKDEKLKHACDSVNSYADKLEDMFKHFGTVLLPQMLLTILEVLVYALIPYFIIVGLGGNTVDYTILDYLTIYIFVHFSSSIMPTPGMTGGAELLFLTAFAVVLKDSPLFWAMVIWRFLTFYFYLIQGFVITLIDSVKKSRQMKKIISAKSTDKA